MLTAQNISGPALCRSLRIYFIALLACVSCTTVALAQGGVGSSRGLPASSGGIHQIQGRVLFPDQSKAKRVRVRLESVNFYNQSAQTDEDGAFRFNGLEAGSYTVTVEGGDEFEPARENVAIDREASPNARTIQVTINLRPKGMGEPAGATSSALAGVPKDALDLYTKGMDSARKGDSKKAVEQLSGAVALYQNFPLALNELGVQYLKMGQADKAAEALQRAVKLAPSEFYPHLNYGIALLNKKNYVDAETELRAALKINSNSPVGHMYLGVALLTLSRDEKTKQYDMAKYAEAQKELETAAASGKAEVAMAHKYLGGIYMGNKEYKRAADELELYLKLSPKAPDAEKLKAIVKDLRSKQ